MEISHILEELAYDFNGSLPREAIEAAISKSKTITPFLINVLEDAVVRISDIIEDDNYCGHIYAMYLLAQFRSQQALQIILTLCSFPNDMTYSAIGDVLTEDLHRILASLCTEPSVLYPLIENPNANEYVRASATSAIVSLVGSGKLNRNTAISYFKELLSHKLEKKPSFMWDNLIYSTCTLYPIELCDLIQQAFDDKLIDSSFINMNDINEIIQEETKESCLIDLYKNTELIDDTLSEMEKWIESYNT